jgi:hypothetical protein
MTAMIIESVLSDMLFLSIFCGGNSAVGCESSYHYSMDMLKVMMVGHASIIINRERVQTST